MPPAVTVVIPYSDGIEWTTEAVQSVLRQTFQDFEIILVDDGSENGCREILEKLDGRIRYLYQSNRGPAAARNKGIRNASGEFIAFLDSDDLFEPRKMEIQVSALRANPGILFSHTSYKRIDALGNEIGDVGSGKFSGSVYPEIWGNCPIATPTVMIRKTALADLAFNEEVRIGEDIILWAEISKRSEIAGIDLPLTRVRLHAVNASLDMRKQIQGLRNLIACGVCRDAQIGFLAKRKAKAALYHKLFFAHASSARLWQGYLCGLRAVLCWPFDSALYISLARPFVPSGARRTLRRLWQRIADR